MHPRTEVKRFEQRFREISRDCFVEKEEEESIVTYVDVSNQVNKLEREYKSPNNNENRKE